MINIVIPMAGRGSRFKNVGYLDPKPLIEVRNKKMIELVIHNLRPKGEHRFIFLCLREHEEKYNIQEMLKKWAPDSNVIFVDEVTEGAACTVLLAKELINNEDELMIANSDQYVDININEYLAEFEKRNLDALIMTMYANNPKWSFVKKEGDLVSLVVEKQVISNEATVGIYNYKRGSYFVEAAEKMIAENIRVNNEFYVAPAYNIMVEDGYRIGTYEIGEECKGMYGLGIPEDLEWFLSNPIADKALQF